MFWVFYLINGAGITPNLWVLSLPLLMLVMAGMGLGLGIIVSSLTSKYRDLQHLVNFGVQLLMYTTPVIYPLSSVTGIWRIAILLNPMTPVIEMFRFAFMGVSSIDPQYLIYSSLFSLGVFFIGILIFNRIETTFMDTV